MEVEDVHLADDSEEQTVELEHAADVAKEAFTTYMGARRRMQEHVDDGVFYPIVAIGPGFDDDGEGRGKGGFQTTGTGPRHLGKGRGKDRDTDRGKRSGKGPARPRGPALHPDGSPKTTSSGSTQQHRPRFTRRRGG